MALNVRDYLSNSSETNIAKITKSKVRAEAFAEFVDALAAVGRGKDERVFAYIGVLLADESKFGSAATMGQIEKKLRSLEEAFDGFRDINNLLQENVGSFYNDEDRSRILKYESLAATFEQILKEDLRFIHRRRSVFKKGTQANPKDIYLLVIYKACRIFLEDEDIAFKKHYREFEGTSNAPKVTAARLVTLISIVVGDVRTEKAITQMIVRETNNGTIQSLNLA